MRFNIHIFHISTFSLLTELCIRYGFLLLDGVASQDPLGVSVSILHQFGILAEMYQVGYTKLFFRTGQVRRVFFEVLKTSFLIFISLYLCRCFGQIKVKQAFPLSIQIGVLEDTRNRTLHGILHVQSCFRGHQARRQFREIRRGVTTLQSCMAF